MTVDEHLTRLSTLDGEFTQLEEFVRINDGFYRFRGMHVNITVMKEKLVIKDESQRQTGWNRGAWGDIGRFLRDMEAKTPQAPPPSWVGHVQSTPGGGVRNLKKGEVLDEYGTQPAERSAAARRAAQEAGDAARSSAKGIPGQRPEKRSPGMQYRSMSPLRVEPGVHKQESSHMFAIRNWREAAQTQDREKVQPPRGEATFREPESAKRNSLSLQHAAQPAMHAAATAALAAAQPPAEPVPAPAAWEPALQTSVLRPAQPAGPTAEHSAGHVSERPAGHSARPQGGNSAGYSGGGAVGQSAGRSAGVSAGQSARQLAGNSARQSVGQPARNTAGPPAAQRLGQRRRADEPARSSQATVQRPGVSPRPDSRLGVSPRQTPRPLETAARERIRQSARSPATGPRAGQRAVSPSAVQPSGGKPRGASPPGVRSAAQLAGPRVGSRPARQPAAQPAQEPREHPAEHLGARELASLAERVAAQLAAPPPAAPPCAALPAGPPVGPPAEPSSARERAARAAEQLVAALQPAAEHAAGQTAGQTGKPPAAEPVTQPVRRPLTPEELAEQAVGEPAGALLGQLLGQLVEQGNEKFAGLLVGQLVGQLAGQPGTESGRQPDGSAAAEEPRARRAAEPASDPARPQSSDRRLSARSARQPVRDEIAPDDDHVYHIGGRQGSPLPEREHVPPAPAVAHHLYDHDGERQQGYHLGGSPARPAGAARRPGAAPPPAAGADGAVLRRASDSAPYLGPDSEAMRAEYARKLGTPAWGDAANQPTPSDWSPDTDRRAPPGRRLSPPGAAGRRLAPTPSMPALTLGAEALAGPPLAVSPLASPSRRSQRSSAGRSSSASPVRPPSPTQPRLRSEDLAAQARSTRMQLRETGVPMLVQKCAAIAGRLERIERRHAALKPRPR